MKRHSRQRWTAILLTLIALLAVPAHHRAQAGDAPDLSPGALSVVRVYYADPTQRVQLLISFQAQLLETNYEAGYHVMQLSGAEIQRLTDTGLTVVADPDWRPQPPPESTASPAQASGIPGYPCYRTVEETLAAARQLALDYPHLAIWQDVGDSWEKSAGQGGYDIWVLRLTNSALPGPKPVLLLNAAIHAREYATAELVTRFMEGLVEDYGQSADATWILDYHEVHAILHANPDGRKQAEAGLSWRKNTNQAYCRQDSAQRGADLNRNLDFQWNCCGGSSDDPCALTYHGPFAASEPEIQALQGHILAAFPDQRGPGLLDPAPDDASGLFLDIHSYGELVLWPWGFTYADAPNAAQLQILGRKLAYWNHYTPAQAVGLYPTDGTSDSYVYGNLGVAAYTMELGTRFFQSCADFETTIVPDNLPALLYAAKVARTPYQAPAGPESIQLSLSAHEVTAGTPVTLTATIDDTRYGTANGREPSQTVVTAEWYLDTPPWQTGAVGTAMDAADGRWDNSVEDGTAVLDTTGWEPGRHMLYLRGQDADDNWGAVSALFVSIAAGAAPSQLYLPYVPTGDSP